MIISGKQDVLDYLIGIGVDINQKTTNGDTPLCLAISKGIFFH